jgi:hypothetical protein
VRSWLTRDQAAIDLSVTIGDLSDTSSAYANNL